jgi:glucokinase
MDRTFIGIEIGGTKLQLVAGDGSGQILRRWRVSVDPTKAGSGIRNQLQQLLPEVRAVHPIAIGVGFGGPIDRGSGRIARSHQVGGWEDFALRDWLADQCEVPVVVENDSNAAALAEAMLGAGRGTSPVFYFNLGSGVGGGLAIDGKIYHGLAPGEAEFGHLLLDRSGSTVESRCSGWAIDRRIRQSSAGQPDGILARLIGITPGGEARHLKSALARGDSAARAILEDLSDDLGFALSHVVHLVHPAVIVLGGGLSLLGEPLREGIERAARGYVMRAFAPGPAIRLAALGEDAVPTGALLLAAALT